MGHAVYYSRYPESSIKKVYGRWNISFWDQMLEDISHETDWYGGYHGDFSVYDREVFMNEKLAKEFLERHFVGYHDGAVRYYIANPSEAQKKKEKELNEEIEELYRGISNDTVALDYLSKLSSKLLSCETCESRINRQYLIKRGTSKCPVCRSDSILPISVRSRIKKQEEKLSSLRKKLEDLHRNEKPSKNAKTGWLVKVEYHI